MPREFLFTIARKTEPRLTYDLAFSAIRAPLEKPVRDQTSVNNIVGGDKNYPKMPRGE
jgi:hypothetical protein